MNKDMEQKSKQQNSELATMSKRIEDLCTKIGWQYTKVNPKKNEARNFTVSFKKPSQK